MSKAGFILYGAKGKIGNIVAQKGSTGTIVREKVDPANPRTPGQMLQRAKFADVSKFYKNAIANLFQFAFEDKKKGESDYNVLFRKNIVNALPLMKEQSQASGFPAIGQFVTTSGSLNQIVTRIDTKPYIVINGASTIEQTVGYVSAALISQYGLQEGDLITILTVNMGLNYYNTVNSENPVSSFPIAAATRSSMSKIQFKLDSTSSVALTTLDANLKVASATKLEFGEAITLVEEGEETKFNTPASYEYAVIASRTLTDGTLLVSPASLVLNSDATPLTQHYMSYYHIQQCILSWGGENKEAVLKDMDTKYSTATSIDKRIYAQAGARLEWIGDNMPTTAKPNGTELWQEAVALMDDSAPTIEQVLWRYQFDSSPYAIIMPSEGGYQTHSSIDPNTVVKYA